MCMRQGSNSHVCSAHAVLLNCYAKILRRLARDRRQYPALRAWAWRIASSLLAIPFLKLACHATSHVPAGKWHRAGPRIVHMPSRREERRRHQRWIPAH